MALKYKVRQVIIPDSIDNGVKLVVKFGTGETAFTKSYFVQPKHVQKREDIESIIKSDGEAIEAFKGVVDELIEEAEVKGTKVVDATEET